MRRVAVIGTSGVGKTRLARKLAQRLGVPHIELDALFWSGPGWQPRQSDVFRHDVDEATQRDGWVVDGNYHQLVQDIVLGRADTVVWLDLARAVVMWQIVTRTLVRVAFRRELWNGNQERWRNLMTLDPAESVIVWAWSTHRARRDRYLAQMESAGWSHLRVIRLRSRRHVASLLKNLCRPGPELPAQAPLRP